MEHWSPESVFLLTGLLGGLAGAVKEARTHKTITKWAAMWACFDYGFTASALGMVGYQWLGGKEHPEMIIGMGMLVGLRLLTIKQIRELVKRFFNLGNGK